MTEQTAPAIPAGYMQDAKGRLVPEHLVKAEDKLEDQMVRKILGYADELSAQIAPDGCRVMTYDPNQARRFGGGAVACAALVADPRLEDLVAVCHEWVTDGVCVTEADDPLVNLTDDRRPTLQPQCDLCGWPEDACRCGWDEGDDN